MATDNSLAIIIPAFKSRYLKECLNSISNQTNKNFNVYIGNDNSLEDIETIVSCFSDSLNITYKKFADNLGSTSITKHWERCIEMMHGEQWIWLFSDDDFMDAKCVQSFQEELEAGENDIYKFNSIKFKDDFSLIKTNVHPSEMKTIDFLNGKFNYIYESYAVEYIFKKSLYVKTGGFPDFPLGWCSDDAFWIKCSLFSSIKTIRHAYVYWRISDLNISGAAAGKGNRLLKLEACIMFLKWLKKENITKIDEQIDNWIFFWFLKQYQYLTINFRSYSDVKYLITAMLLCPKGAFTYCTGLKPAAIFVDI